MRNIRYALRLLRNSPGFTTIALLTLALGIGVNSAIFSVVDAVMLRPLPYAEPERLVSLWEMVTGPPPAIVKTVNSPDYPRRSTVSPANLMDYRTAPSFSGLAAHEYAAMNLSQAGAPERIWGERVSSNFFDVLGIQPERGRAILPEEDRPGVPKVVVISHELWARRFGLDPEMIGKSIMLDGVPHRVIGIMAAGFEAPAQFGFSDRLQFFIPEAFPADLLANRGDHEVNVAGRLRPGASIEQARAELDAISTRLASQYPDTNKNYKTAIAPMREDIARNVRTSLLVLLGAVGLILLIACANLANLLMARAVGRLREVSIRIAIGASRGRVIRELVGQSLVLAGLGGMAGLALGSWARQLILRWAPGGIPRLDGASLDWRVLLFTVSVAFLTGLAFGLFPAFQVAAGAPIDSLRSNDRSVAGGAVLRWRAIFMAAEIALSMMLLIGAGLLLRSFIVLNKVDLGFQTERVLAMNINLPDEGYKTPEQRLAFFEDLTARVTALPGVVAAGFSNRMPMRGGWSGGFQIPGLTGSYEAELQAVSPGYFETLGFTLLRGRLLTPADRNGAMPVAVVNAAFSRMFLQGGDPVGRQIQRNPTAPLITIVGVVADIHRSGKTEAANPAIYFPAAQTNLYPVRIADFAFRTANDPKPLIAAVERQVWAIDRNQPVTNVKTLAEVVSQSVAQRRFQMWLLLLFAGLAFILSVIGVYGVIAYSVSQRTKEIGLRIALGAGRRDILFMIVVRGMLVVASGILAGAAGAYAISRSLRSLLFEIQPADGVTYFAVAGLLSIVAPAACYLPARRAAAVDPMVALRYE